MSQPVGLKNAQHDVLSQAARYSCHLHCYSLSSFRADDTDKRLTSSQRQSE